MSTSLLEARGISKTYGPRGLRKSHARNVLDGVDLTVGKGESIALIGRSGSGKSTLGRILLGLEPADHGAVIFKDRPLKAMNHDERRRFRMSVQAVLQDPLSAVNPRQSVERIINEPLRHLTDLPARERSAQVAMLLEMVGLKRDDAAKLPSQLSGGQLQRVCLARALAPEPELLVLDEAVSNLDIPLQVAMLDLVAGLRTDKKIATLFITHDIRLAWRFCDQIVVLEEGRIVDRSPTHPSPTFTAPAALKLVSSILPARPLRPQMPTRDDVRRK
jgi:nickel transport system ATP-binding protein